MTIANTGPFIPQHEVAGLLEPFTRGRDRVGTGNGLGLSIVAAVVRSHAGSLDIRSREGGGLEVRLALPA
jgi:signal transduction histidine kinase